jgi:hypothetical protein
MLSIDGSSPLFSAPMTLVVIPEVTAGIKFRAYRFGQQTRDKKQADKKDPPTSACGPRSG